MVLFGRLLLRSRVRVGIVVVSGRPELLAVARDAWGAIRLPREGAVALARHGGHDVLLQLGPLITDVVREDPDHLRRRRRGAIGRRWLSSLDFFEC